MSDNKYHFTRDGNHVKLISKSQIQDDSESSSLITPKKAKRSIWSMVSIFFSWFYCIYFYDFIPLQKIVPHYIYISYGSN